MDPIITKAAGLGSGPAQGAQVDRAPKVEPSKFDKVRENLKAESPASTEQAAAADKPPPASASARLDSMKPSHEVFKPQMERNQVQLADLHQRVDRLPKSDALDPLKKRLSMLEGQQAGINAGLGKINQASEPAEFLNMQMQVYQISEQIEMITKVVDQLASGVKSVLQTQV